MTTIKKLNLIIVLLSIFSVIAFAQNNYYYYKGQRIPLTINPNKVNVISMANGPQYAPSMQPSVLPNGLEVESVISDSPYNMCIIKNNTTNPNLLNNYVNSTINPNYNVILPCYYSPIGKEVMTNNYLYIKVKDPNDLTALQHYVSTYNLQIIDRDAYMPQWFIVSITLQTPFKTVEMANMLYETGAFITCEPSFMYDCLMDISWDSDVSKQWGLYNANNDTIDINASSAWNYATGRGVKVAIVDSGVDYTHDDLSENISGLYFDSEPFHPARSRYSQHGTHVAGIVAASRNNGKFGAGVAPDAEIMAASVNTSKSNPLIESRFAQSINWAWRNGADIINCSWGGIEKMFVNNAIDNALINGRNGKGCVLVFAVGNYNDSVAFPANYKNEILAVGAISSNGLRISEGFLKGSCYGPELDVVAPGNTIYSTLPNNLGGFKSGTSMAAPHVAGIAALILELNPDLTGQQVRDIIEQSTIKVGNVEYTDMVGRPNGTWNEEYGYGLVDALKAVKNTPRKQIEY